MVDKLNEFDLISNVFGPLAANAPGSLNLIDDAAIIAGGVPLPQLGPARGAPRFRGDAREDGCITWGARRTVLRRQEPHRTGRVLGAVPRTLRGATTAFARRPKAARHDALSSPEPVVRRDGVYDGVEIKFQAPLIT